MPKFAYPAGGQRTTLLLPCGKRARGSPREMGFWFKMHQRVCEKCAECATKLPAFVKEQGNRNGWDGVGGSGVIDENVFQRVEISGVDEVSMPRDDEKSSFDAKQAYLKWVHLSSYDPDEQAHCQATFEVDMAAINAEAQELEAEAEVFATGFFSLDGDEEEEVKAEVEIDLS